MDVPKLIERQDFLVGDRPISKVGNHLTGALAEPKSTILTLPFSGWQFCEPCARIAVFCDFVLAGGAHARDNGGCAPQDLSSFLPWQLSPERLPAALTLRTALPSTRWRTQGHELPRGMLRMHRDGLIQLPELPAPQPANFQRPLQVPYGIEDVPDVKFVCIDAV